MTMKNLTRRDFTKLSMAAFGGAVGGATLVGCGEGESPDATKPAGAPTQPADAQQASADANRLLTEPHVCRGMNSCKGTGAGGENACAGQGKCATAKAHSCNGENACKGQGGCGEQPGQNACNGMGQCAVPLSNEAWAKARKSFEAAMTKAGKQFGTAPAKG